MNSHDKQAFSERLKLALRRSTKLVETPTELALQFNLRHENDPITPQAAQKWLTGKAKPTADKIATLANWLGVSAHWLNYGAPEQRPDTPAPRTASQQTLNGVSGVTADELALLIDYRRLSARRQQLVRDMATELAMEQAVWPDSIEDPR